MRAVKFSVPLPWTDILKRTAAEIYAGNCFAWAASLSYYFFLALFPALLFAISLVRLLPVQPLVREVAAMLGQVAPGDVVAIARQRLDEVRHRDEPDRRGGHAGRHDRGEVRVDVTADHSGRAADEADAYRQV